MTCPFGQGGTGPTRRGLLAGVGGLIAAGAVHARAATETRPPTVASSEPFFGAHQTGIATPQPMHTYFVAFDLVAKTRDEVTTMLRTWTDAAARMTSGQTARPLGEDLSVEAPDGASALGLSPARLTVTFGFGAGLFIKDGVDRYGLAAKRPQALVDLPKFNGDQLMPARTGGDLSVQACGDDPLVAFHAVRELERLGYGVVKTRWAQSGFLPNSPAGETPRNLMGFKDGTNNPAPGMTTPDIPRDLGDVVWVGDEGPLWMRGGSYLVARRIRISLEHWDRTEVDFQEQVIGRHKYSGAPIGKASERDPLGLDRVDKDGDPLIADNAHVRLGAAAVNDGAQILRRAYSYNDGVALTAERWPPWRQGMMYDAGLFFLAYQRDPRTGFIKIFENMAKLDALNQFTTHTGGGLFACPGGVREGAFIGQSLFQG
ncbi:MAG TPA: Dyp-type peroxidase [Roseiarcus sp.]